MLGASCDLEVSEIVLTEWKTPEETEDEINIRLIQGCVQFWCLNGISEGGIQAQFKVSNGLV